jgi:O-methyltransferase involved in polyketide biosynthesis
LIFIALDNRLIWPAKSDSFRRRRLQICLVENIRPPETHKIRLGEMNQQRAKVQLTDVPETALWNLYHRAEAARSGRLDDPRALELVSRLDYPFEQFNSPYRGLAARMHAQRVRTIDAAVRRLLDVTPDATVVALGEGFETQFWRVDNGQLSWLTLDLPEVIAVRQQVLPDDPRCRTVAGSATDAGWIADVNGSKPVMLTAQGLLMYFQRDEVHQMLSTWADRMPGATLVFDAVTKALQASRRKSPSNDSYHPPQWTWAFDDDEARRLRQLPGVAELSEAPQDGTDRLLRAARKVPVVSNVLPTFPVLIARLDAARA